MKLYEIPAVAQEIERELTDNFGELTPELEAKISGFLSLGEDKVEASVAVVRSMESDAEACRTEAKRLQDRANSFEARAEYLKRMILIAVDAGFGGKVKTAKFTIWGQNSPDSTSFDVAPGADVIELAAAHDWAFRAKLPELNKVALKDAFKAGKVIPDGITVVTLPGNRTLRIK